LFCPLSAILLCALIGKHILLATGQPIISYCSHAEHGVKTV
jgi:hypothetical protein